MRNYQTFQEAKIENPELKIYYSMIARCGKDAVFGTYDSLIRFTDSFHECKPEDYLPSVEWFYSNGYSFEYGDLISDRDGNVIEVSESYMQMIADHYYVLRASCLTETKVITESPEEKEALDMIDTTSKQVESLAKGDGVEWKSGDKCILAGYEFTFGCVNPIREKGYVVVFDEDGDPNECYMDELSKPESPEQKAERERLEAIKEMTQTPKPCGFAIYDICEQLYDAGYRKGLK